MATPFPMPEPMRLALDCARAAGAAQEVPIGAVVTRDGHVIATGENRNRRDNDPTAHAEIVAMRAACAALGTDRLPGCDLWVTLEPCPMCAGAIAHARVARLYYGALDAKAGGVEHGARVFSHPQCHHKPELFGGIGADSAGAMLRDFFAGKR